jgi:hypothetical protein
MIVNKMRLRFDQVEVRPERPGQVRALVTFTFGPRTLVTSAVESDTWPGSLRAASLASLEAVQQAAGYKFKCVVEDLDRVNALGKQLIAVLVNVEFEDRQFQVFGSCQIDDDEVIAAVRATLNATNRIVDLATKSS